MSDILTQSTTESTTAEPTAQVSTPAAITSLADILPEELKSEPSLQTFKDIPSLAKSYVSAQKMIGNSIRIPGEDASEEVKAAFLSKLQSIPGVVKAPDPENIEDLRSFYKSIGCPEKPEDYKLSISDERKDMLQSPVIQQAIREAHSLGATPKQVQAIVDSRIESLIASKAEEEKQLLESKKSLTSIWGNEYDNHIKQALAAADILKTKFPTEMEALLSGPSRNNPALLAALSDLGANLKEKGHAGMAAVRFGGLSPEEASSKIDEVFSNNKHPYFDSKHPSHMEARAKVREYFNIVSQGRNSN